MKLFEVLRDDIAPVSDQQLIDKLKSFNWRYEFSDSSYKIQKGERELEILENLVYQVWKNNPEKAVQIWNQHAPGAKPNTVPSFIFRLQVQEENHEAA